MLSYIQIIYADNIISYMLHQHNYFTSILFKCHYFNLLCITIICYINIIYITLCLHNYIVMLM